MTNQGPQSLPPIAPPPPPSNGPIKKRNAQLTPETQGEIERLTKLVQDLQKKIDAGNRNAEIEYDNLKKTLSNNLAKFNKETVSLIDAKVKQLEDALNTQVEILTQEIKSAHSRVSEITRQQGALQKQKERFANIKTPESAKLIDTIDETLQLLIKEHESINQFLEQGLAQTKSKQNEIMLALTKAKEKQTQIHKEKMQLVALCQTVPARVKEKIISTKKLEVNFKAWIENGLLDGLFLQNLKSFIEKTSDQEVIDRYTTLLNPAVRILLPCLSLHDVLGIAAGYVFRPAHIPYIDANPLKGSLVQTNNQWLFEMLKEDFYTANPELKENIPNGINTTPVSHKSKTHEPTSAKVQQSTTMPITTSEVQVTPPAPIKLDVQKPLTIKIPVISHIENEQSPAISVPVTVKENEKEKQQELTNYILNEMKVSRQELIELSRIIQQLNADSTDVNIALSDEVLLQQALEKLKLVKVAMDQERTKLKAEFETFQAQKETFENQSFALGQMKEKLIQTQQQLTQTTQQLTQTTQQLTQTTQQLGYTKQQLSPVQSLTPLEVLQKEGLEGLGHALYLYKKTTGNMPSFAMLNQWGDGAGLRKNPAWKPKISQPSALVAAYMNKL